MKASVVKALVREETNYLSEEIARVEKRLVALAGALGKQIEYDSGLPEVTDTPEDTE